MNPTKHLDGACSECGGPLSFPAVKIGQMDRCPHCGQMTELMLASPPEEPAVSRKLILWALVGVVILVVGGLGPVLGLKHFQKQLDAKRKGRGALDEAGAVAVARQAVGTNDTWGERATFEPRRNGAGWTVTVWREPRTPGGFRIVEIDAQGKVKAYERGR